MIRFTQGALAKVLVASCIMMQVAIMLPHHHHEGSAVPCINIFHCAEGDCRQHTQHSCGCGAHHSEFPAAAGDSHDHDSGSHECALTHLDVIRLERERVAGPVELAAQMMMAQAIHICPVHDSDAINSLNTIQQLDRKRLRVEVPLPTSYIAAAIPPRAPSFTA